MIYLDNAATTLMKPRSVAKAAERAISNLASPGRGGHKYAMDAAQMAFSCRVAAGELFKVSDPENVAFTYNATHGLNMAIRTFAKPGYRVIVSGYEHNSVVRPLSEMGADMRVVRSRLFDKNDAIEKFSAAITRGTKLVVCNQMSNVFGCILPVKEISQMCKAYSIPFIVDVSQSAGSVDIDFSSLGADFIAMPGHKGLYGPQGTGLLLCARKPLPLLSGGTGSNSESEFMPQFLPDIAEAGTHNMPGIAGLKEGIDFVIKTGTDKIFAHEKALIKYLADNIKSISDIVAYVPQNSDDLSGVMSFNIRGKSSETVGQMLADRQIAVRAGLHCSPQAHKTAGTFETGTVRVSVSAFNTKRDIEALLNSLEDIKNSK